MSKQSNRPIPEDLPLLLRRKPGHPLHFEGDPVVTMVGVPAKIASQVISHVNQFFRNHHFQ